MKIFKEYKMTIIGMAVLMILYFFKRDLAMNSVSLSLKSAVTMLGVLPPVLLIVNLLDNWIPRETIVRHMGEQAGLMGYFWALLLGTFGAGPLYAAFPVAALLAKKGARISFLVFFLGIWTTVKLPIFMYELNFFGLQFTITHIITGIFFYLIFSEFMEKLLLRSKAKLVYERLSKI